MPSAAPPTASHTEGPWHERPMRGDLSGTWAGTIPIGAADQIALVIVRHADGGLGKANARLIAAAPKLLAVAQAVVSRFEYYIGNPSAWDCYSDDVSELMRGVHTLARAAIADATTPVPGSPVATPPSNEEGVVP